MADDIVVTQGSNSIPANITFASDEVGGRQFIKEKLVFGPNDVITDVTVATPFPTRAYDGVFSYAAGTSATTITLNSGACLRRFSLLAAGSQATVVIFNGDTIFIPAGSSFDEAFVGQAIAGPNGNDVVIGGGVQAYYIAWTED